MPLVRVDYNDKKLNSVKAQELVTLILETSKRVFKTNDDKISIFTKKNDVIDFSTATAEIEIRAKIAEFEDSSLTKDEVRVKFIQEYEQDLNSYILKNSLKSGIILTITFEDWQVRWLPPVD